MFLAANNSLQWLQIVGSEPLDEQLQVLAAWYSFCAGKLRVFKVINGVDVPWLSMQAWHECL